MIIWPGKQIDQPSDERNCLSKEYTAELVAVCNAILNLKFKGGAKITISDKGMLIDLDNLLNGSSSSTTSSDLPWQITLQDTPDGRTVQVGDGLVFYSQFPNSTTSGASLNPCYPSGTNTNITFPAVDGTYSIWLYCATGLAAVQSEPAQTFPTAAEWPSGPSPAVVDYDYATAYQGYVLVGTVVVSGSDFTIQQQLFDNPKLLNLTGSGIATMRGVWDTSKNYRVGSIVTYGGATYYRQYVAFEGANGGTPGASLDWEVL